MKRTPAVGMFSVVITSSGRHALTTPAATKSTESLKMRRMCLRNSEEVEAGEPAIRAGGCGIEYHLCLVGPDDRLCQDPAGHAKPLLLRVHLQPQR